MVLSLLFTNFRIAALILAVSTSWAWDEDEVGLHIDEKLQFSNGHLYVVEERLGKGGHGVAYKLRRIEPPCLPSETCLVSARVLGHKRELYWRNEDSVKKLLSLAEHVPHIRAEYEDVEVDRVDIRTKKKANIYEYAESFANGGLESLKLSPHSTEKELIASRILAEQLFYAVDQLKKRGLVHRDISPENLALMGKTASANSIIQGETYLSIADSNDYIMKEGDYLPISGKPSFMPYEVSPEMYVKSSIKRPQTIHGDVYAASTSLYEILLGTDPIADYLGDRIPKAPLLPKMEDRVFFTPEMRENFKKELKEYTELTLKRWERIHEIMNREGEVEQFLKFVGDRFDKLAESTKGPHRKPHIYALKEMVLGGLQKNPQDRRSKWPLTYSKRIVSEIQKHASKSRPLFQSLTKKPSLKELVLDFVKRTCVRRSLEN